jgi:hypothetical protein
MSLILSKKPEFLDIPPVGNEGSVLVQRMLGVLVVIELASPGE